MRGRALCSISLEKMYIQGDHNMDFLNLSQAEIAGLFGVDRTTIRAWQLVGMPYQRPAAKGAKAGYCAAVCIHWRAGHRLAESRRVDLTAHQKLAVGWLAGFRAAQPSNGDLSCYLAMMNESGLDQEGALRQLEFARGFWRL